MPSRNLIIIVDPRLLDYRDFEEISRLVNVRNSEIRVSILSYNDDVANFPMIDWRLPTFTVSLVPYARSLPKRGTVFFNREIDKFNEVGIMMKAGIPVPRSEPYEKNKKYNPAIWGDFVIIKSREQKGSSKGNTAYLTPVTFLTTPEVFEDPVKSLLINGTAIVQEFIPTGLRPVSHRACTFLGRVLYLMADIAPMPIPKLNPNSNEIHLYDSKFQDDARGLIRKRILHHDPKIIEFAQSIAKAFPGIPLLGIDIVKNEETGYLYALEVNAGGNTWHFSSPAAAEGRTFVTREERIKQFGAWEIAASALIEKTLYYAK